METPLAGIVDSPCREVQELVLKKFEMRLKVKKVAFSRIDLSDCVRWVLEVWKT